MCDEWAEPRWDSDTYEQNHLNVTTRDWERSVARTWTRAKNAKAKYNPNFSRNRVEQLELECARGESGHPIKTTGNIRTFYRHVGDLFHGRPIGASSGEDTEYIFVIRQRDGSVHGYPITKAELRSKKGVRL